MKRIFVFVAMLFVLSISSSWGATPVKEYILYSLPFPTLTSGEAYTIRFSLWDAAPLTNGNMVWSEEKSIVLPGDKTITTNLGSVVTLTTADFSKQYFLQVDTKDTTTGTYTPVGTRTRFTMVPYAIYAETGGSITSVTAGSGLTGGGTEGDLTLSVAAGGIVSSMLRNNAVTTGKIATGAVTASKIGISCPDGQYMKFRVATGWGCSAGTAGLPGPQGPKGDTGPQGPKGDTGPAAPLVIDGSMIAGFGNAGYCSQGSCRTLTVSGSTFASNVQCGTDGCMIAGGGNAGYCSQGSCLNVSVTGSITGSSLQCGEEGCMIAGGGNAGYCSKGSCRTVSVSGSTTASHISTFIQ